MIISEYRKKLEAYRGRTAIGADFREFWRQKMTKAPESVTLEPVPFVNPMAVYENLTLSMGDFSIRARVIRPSRAGRHPLVLMFHDLHREIRGWHHMTRFIAQGCGVVALDAPVNKADWQKAPESVGFEDYIRDALILAEFARKMPWVDGEKIVTWGEGLGGGLAIAAASFIPGSRCCALNPLPADVESLPCCDIAAFAPHVTGQVLLGVCLMDTVAPPEGQYAIYNRLTCEKQIKVYPKYVHERVNFFENEMLSFLRSLF